MLYRSLRAHLGVKLPSPDRDNKTNLTTSGRFLATGGHECYRHDSEEREYSSVGKESACNAGDWGSIPGLGRSSGERNGNPFQYSRLENPIDRRAWQATVPGLTRVGHDSN